MYDGKQVVRVANQYKKADLYNIGVEMTDRKGTGNYDIKRTEFNYEYVPLTQNNLYQEVKKNLKDRNIEYLNKPSTNLLNGVTFTSGPEFFQSLGMKFIDSGRTYHTGDKKGQSVMIPNIKSKEDIPNAVSFFFDCCMEFLKDYVGEENIVLAQVHYDEDTPHLQAYFVPVVDKVKRKCYVKDDNGNVIKEEVIKKDGTTSIVPKLLRDSNGKIIYEEVNGKFLNCDQFWKQKGGASSFHQMQNDFNKFITEKGFNLYRGDIGANKESQTKLDYDIAEKKAELEELNKEKENTLKIIENSKSGLKNLENIKNDNNELLNPVKRKLGGFKEDDVFKIIEYTKGLEHKIVILSTDNCNKDLMIDKLTNENKTFKNNNELIKRNELIKEQKSTIKEQKQEIGRLNELVDILNNNIESLKSKFEKEVNKWKNLLKKMCKAIDKVLGRDKPKENLEDYEDIADAINYGYYSKNDDKDKDDYEIGL
ncbi:MAG: plasmid recombination protein [Bacilli bacterium]